MQYVFTWMNAECGILATTDVEASSLTAALMQAYTAALMQAYGASKREDGEGAVSVTIECIPESEGE